MTALSDTPIAVLGAGSWGTALAVLLAKKGQSVRLWGHDLNHIQQMTQEGVNSRYLPHIAFPPALHLFHDLSSALKGVQDIVIVVPSRVFVELLMRIKPYLLPETRLIWGTKGLTAQRELLHVAAQKIVGMHRSLAVLSGPSFATEVAKQLPTAVTLAAVNPQCGTFWSTLFSTEYFRVYTTNDMVGVEACGVVKNTLAIASGVVEELRLGANALSALITRGLVEMQKFGMALGGRSETFYGLAGLGDLVLSCTDNQSRNRRFGKAMAGGKSAADSLREIGQAVEGYANLETVCQLARQQGVDMPITEQIYQMIYHKKSPQDAIRTLFSRGLKGEYFEG